MTEEFDADCSFCNEIMGYPENNMFLRHFQEYINNSFKKEF